MAIRRTLAALCLLLAVPAHAADTLPLWSGTPVTILRANGASETARFHSIAQDPPRLLVLDENARTWGGAVRTNEIPLADVATISGPVGTRFRGRHFVLCTVIGAATGG